VAIIPSPAQVLTSRHYESREYWLDVPSPVLGTVRLPGPPYRASEGTFAPYRPAPRLGEHTDEVLQELNLSLVDRLALAAVGAVA
jgi:crotonobetainyl-CoA:carnitine CoA-transferase CaiB-like acyl-CoA transferase